MHEYVVGLLMVYGSRFIEIKEYVLSLESLYVFVANKPFMYKRNSSAYLSQKTFWHACRQYVYFVDHYLSNITQVNF